MHEQTAANKADDIIKILLTHQQNPLGSNPLFEEEDARKTAKTIATFRKELFDLLKDQPF